MLPSAPPGEVSVSRLKAHSAAPAVQSQDSASVPHDGWSALAYDEGTNRITSAGFAYDAAGNQISHKSADEAVQRLEYDAAGRLARVVDAASNTVFARYTYGAGNQRLITESGSADSYARTYYVWGSGGVIAEYSEVGPPALIPQWQKTYVHLGARLLATVEPGAGRERVQYHHPDRLGTRLVTNTADRTYFEQVGLPFGTALEAESTGVTNRRFTSYDRSGATGLDYAVNRYYDAQQGRFTQVDPLGMKATSLVNPQSLNLYAYVENDPVNKVDPDGQLAFLAPLVGAAIGAAGAIITQGITNWANGQSFFREQARWATDTQ